MSEGGGSPNAESGRDCVVWREYLPVALWGLAGLIVAFFPIFFGGEALYFRDLSRYFVPARKVIAEALLNGELPLWDPYVYAGVPMIAQLGLAVAYPLNIFYLFLDVADATSALILVHYPIALLTSYRFLRRLHLSPMAAVFGGTVWAWSGIMFCDAAHPSHIVFMAWCPLLLAAAHTVPLTRGFLFLTILWALICTSGSAERLIVFSPVLLGYAFLQGGTRRAAAAFFGQATGSLIAAPLWLPAIVYMMTSSIRAGGFSFAVSTADSIEFARLGTVFLPMSVVNESGRAVAPHLFPGGFPAYPSVYAGCIASLFAAASLHRSAFGERRERAVIFFWLVVGLAGIWLAMGRYAPGYHFAWEHLPLMSSFRYPSKYIFLTLLAITVLSAKGYEHLMSSENRAILIREWLRSFFILACVAAPLLLYPFFGSEPLMRDHVSAALSGVLFEAGVFLAVAIAIVALRFRMPSLKLLLPVVVFLDLAGAAGRFAPTIDAAFYDPPKVVEFLGRGRTVSDDAWLGSDAPPVLQEKKAASAEVLRLGLVANLGAIWGVRYVNGYPGVVPEPQAVRSYISDALAQADGGAVQLGKLGAVTRIRPLSTPPLPDPWRLIYADEPTATAIYGNPMALPRVRIEGAAGTASIRREGTNWIEVDVVVDEPALLILADNWAPGWQAIVDGSRVVVEKSDQVLRAVRISAGSHSIRFEYWPPGLTASIIMSIAGIALAAAACALEYWRKPLRTGDRGFETRTFN